MAYVGGVHPKEMNLLEVEFLKILQWGLWVDPSEYDFYLKGIMQHFMALEGQVLTSHALTPQV